MEKLTRTAMIDFNENQLVNVRNLFGYSDVGKLRQDIDLLQDWIKKQNHFIIKDFGRDFLERYLIYNKGSIERSKKRLDKLCTFRNLMPEFLQNFDVKNEFNHYFNCCYNCILPMPTPDNYRVISVTAHGYDEKFDLVQYFKYLTVSCEYLLLHDYSAGYEIIADSRNIMWPLVSKLNPVTLHKGATLYVEAMGMRIKHIHCLTGSKFFDVILSLFKQGLTEKLRQRIVIHDSVESLHKYIPKEILPAEYGGSGKSIVEISEQNFKELSTDAHIARVKYMEKAATDESHRVSCKFNEEYSGMPGSFKTLSVD